MEEKQEAKDFDSIADRLLNREAEDTASESSAEKKPEGTETQSNASTAEVDKTEKVKEIESDASLSVDEKIAKVKEILGDDEKAIDAYVKEKGYHKDPAWQKQRELIDKLRKEAGAKSQVSKEDSEALAEFKKFRSSPEYIKGSMKAQGYTEEAIDKKLKESGFEVDSKPEDDVQLVMDKLGIKPDELDVEQLKSLKANISDVVRIADIIFQDRFDKVAPKELGPIKEHMERLSKNENATKLITTIKNTVKTEGILDYEKDVEPALNKFLDDTPEATQADVLEHFKSLNHSLTIERLKTGKKKDERDEKKTNFRQNVPLSQGKLNIQKTGDFEKDADAFLESVNL